MPLHYAIALKRYFIGRLRVAILAAALPVAAQAAWAHGMGGSGGGHSSGGFHSSGSFHSGSHNFAFHHNGDHFRHDGDHFSIIITSLTIASSSGSVTRFMATLITIIPMIMDITIIR